MLEDFPDVIPVKDGRMGYALPPELVYTTNDIGDIDALLAEVQAEVDALRPAYEAAVADRGRTTVGASELEIDRLAPHIADFVRGERPKSPRKGLSPIPALKLVVEDLQAGLLLLWLEAVSLDSEDRVLRQIVDMSLITPRFWSEGPLPGSSGSGW